MNGAQAYPLLLEAAKLGQPRAQAALAIIYSHGMPGVPQDFRQAAYWNEQAAAQGHRGAQYNLAGLYTQGLGGLPVDLGKAATLLNASARQQYAPAQQALGICFEFGEGVARNRQLAIYWLDQAAAQGDQTAIILASWLRKPDTPSFSGEDQLGSYILGKVQASRGQGSAGGPGAFCRTTGTNLSQGQVCPPASALPPGTGNPLYRDR
jgi:TPR repeat protein